MRFKELRNKLSEQHESQSVGFHPQVGPFNPDGSVESPELNISSLTGESLNRLNAFLGSSFCNSYINPSNVVNRIRLKLETIGLHFDYSAPPARVGNGGEQKITTDTLKRGPITNIDVGIHEYPLSYLGGAYGRYPTDPGYEPYNTDNISNKIGTPLVLVVVVEKQINGTYLVKPSIVQK